MLVPMATYLSLRRRILVALMAAFGSLGAIDRGDVG